MRRTTPNKQPNVRRGLMVLEQAMDCGVRKMLDGNKFKVGDALERTRLT